MLAGGAGVRTAVGGRTVTEGVAAGAGPRSRGLAGIKVLWGVAPRPGEFAGRLEGAALGLMRYGGVGVLAEIAAAVGSGPRGFAATGALGVGLGFRGFAGTIGGLLGSCARFGCGAKLIWGSKES